MTICKQHSFCVVKKDANVMAPTEKNRCDDFVALGSVGGGQIG
jgi:hypothetical protein